MSGGTLSLFVFIDAFGERITRKVPFLDGLVAQRLPLDTVFGYSSTCDPTIITGAAPRDHGHFAFFAYDPANSPFGPLRALSMLPASVVDRGRVRHLLSRVVGRMYGYTGYFQLYALPFRYAHLFDYTEKRDIYGPGGINSGLPSIFVEMAAAGIPFFRSDWRLGEQQTLQTARAAVADGRPRLAYVYLAAMDAVLHRDGSQSAEAVRMIEAYDRRIRDLIAVAERAYAEVRVFVFGDHGMTDIVDICPLMAAVQRTGLRFGGDYAAVYDSTMARFWYLNDEARRRIRRVLADEPRGRLLDDATKRQWGVDFPEDRYGEDFFLLDPGVLLCPSFMGVQPLAGMHGFDPFHEDSTAAFVSTVPLARPPRNLADLYTLMRAEVGL